MLSWKLMLQTFFFNFFCDRLTFHFQRSSSDLKAYHVGKILVLASPTNNKLTYNFKSPLIARPYFRAFVMKCKHFCYFFTQYLPLFSIDSFIHFIRMINAESFDKKLLICFGGRFQFFPIFHFVLARFLPRWIFRWIVGVQEFD